MSVSSELSSTITNLQSVYTALGEAGATLPQNKNFANLSTTIESIPTNPTGEGTLSDLKVALQTTEPWNYYKPGSVFADTWNSEDAPLMLATYLTSENNSEYGGAVGAILIRQHLSDSSYFWGSQPTYEQSNIYQFLQSDYYENTSSTLKNLMTDLSIPVADENGLEPNQIMVKWFLPTTTELGALEMAWYSTEGVKFDAFTSDDNTRICSTPSGKVSEYWTRSLYNYSSEQRYPVYIATTGQVRAENYHMYEQTQSSLHNLRPCCFIPK